MKCNKFVLWVNGECWKCCSILCGFCWKPMLGCLLYSSVTNIVLLLQVDATTVKANKTNRGKQISPIVFYGSPHGVPPKRPSSLLQLLNQIRVDLSEQNKLSSRYLWDHSSSLLASIDSFSCPVSFTLWQDFGPFLFRKEIWATFPRQDEAMKFAKGHVHVHVFSYQDRFNGQRRFLVSTYKEFWQRLSYMPPCLHNINLYLLTIWGSFLLAVFKLLLLNFRYKKMDSKFRHHYEVIQEVKKVLLFSFLSHTC